MKTETITVNGEDKEVEVRPITLLCHRGIENIQINGRMEVGPSASWHASGDAVVH